MGPARAVPRPRRPEPRTSPARRSNAQCRRRCSHCRTCSTGPSTRTNPPSVPRRRARRCRPPPSPLRRLRLRSPSRRCPRDRRSCHRGSSRRCRLHRGRRFGRPRSRRRCPSRRPVRLSRTPGPRPRFPSRRGERGLHRCPLGRRRRPPRAMWGAPRALYRSLSWGQNPPVNASPVTVGATLGERRMAARPDAGSALLGLVSHTTMPDARSALPARNPTVEIVPGGHRAIMVHDGLLMVGAIRGAPAFSPRVRRIDDCERAEHRADGDPHKPRGAEDPSSRSLSRPGRKVCRRGRWLRGRRFGWPGARGGGGHDDTLAPRFLALLQDEAMGKGRLTRDVERERVLAGIDDERATVERLGDAETVDSDVHEEDVLSGAVFDVKDERRLGALELVETLGAIVLYDLWQRGFMHRASWSRAAPNCLHAGATAPVCWRPRIDPS